MNWGMQKDRGEVLRYKTKRLIADALNYISSRVYIIRSRWNCRDAVLYGNHDDKKTKFYS